MYELKTCLKKFQESTVKWMKEHENKYDGGLLLNEAGLGKSICVLSVIIDMPIKTLIVCPAGLIDNWINEIKMHTNMKGENIVKYYGSKRFSDVNSTNSDKCIYITSYSIISHEFTNKRFIKKSIFNKIKFKRIVLDEAHYIRNAYSDIHNAIMYLNEMHDYSLKKWIVTATPIFNSQNDMFAYFKFLKLEGIDTRRDWTEKISKNIDGFETLNTWIKKYSLSMKKNIVLQELTDKNETLMYLEFTELEKEFYDALKEYSILRMNTLIKRINLLNKTVFEGSMKKILHSNVMVYILRLKQACNSPWIIFNSMKRLKGIRTMKDAVNKLKYYNSSINMIEECPICYDTTADHIAKPCGHKCCKQCWIKMFNIGIKRCPKCREIVQDISSINNEQENETNSLTQMYYMDKTIKIQKIIDITLNVINNTEKIVIVSQWVSMLDIIKQIFNNHPILKNIKYVSLQGNMLLKNKTKTIHEFQNNTNIKICFVSLMSSAEGINLISANHLILVDSWWNNSKMSQVMDRIHRIGQTKIVNIYKFQIKSSIEEQIQQLITKKEKITKLILNQWNITDKNSYDMSWITNIIKLINN